MYQISRKKDLILTGYGFLSEVDQIIYGRGFTNSPAKNSPRSTSPEA